MGIVVRQSVKSTIVSYTGVVLGIINLTFLSTKILSPEQIGLRDILINTSLALAFFAQLGMSHVVSRFFNRFKNDEAQHSGMLLVSLGMLVLGFAALSVVLIVGKSFFLQAFMEQSPMIADYYWQFIPLTFFVSLQVLFESFARVNYRIVVPTIIRDLGIRIAYTICIISYAQHWISFQQLIYGLILAYAFAAVANIIYLGFLGQLHLGFKYIQINKTALKEMVQYGLWIMFAGAGTIISDRLDGLMLASFVSLATSGIYSISYFIGTVIELPKRVLSMIVTPLVAENMQLNRLDEVKALYHKSSLNQLLIGGVLFTIIWGSIEGVYGFIPNGAVYAQGKMVVFCIGLANVIDMATGINTEIIINSKWYRFNMLLIGLLAILSFSLNYMLIPQFGLKGAAIATLTAMTITNTVKAVFVFRKLGFWPFHTNTLKALAAIGLVMLVAYILPQPIATNRWLMLTYLSLRSGLLVILALIVIAKGKVSPDVDEQLTLLQQRFPILNPILQWLSK